MFVWCKQAALQAWLEMKETANRGARFDELLRVVRVELTAEQCRICLSALFASRPARKCATPGAASHLNESLEYRCTF